ncbi:uncharacterized protein LOC116618169 [Nematostella vectensis]|uniref:uncharacterized protein LOC116618169 n=1 Tax=Nematostella vectensis TaxID=45351 RepID=UPI0020771F07|nr:uncharacterized protein LOC116618169 [Nematostella vectensis]
MALLMAILVLTLPWQLACANQCTRYFEMPGFALFGHVIERLSMRNAEECHRACASANGCVSINHYGATCELNSKSQFTAPQSFGTRPGSHFKVVKREQSCSNQLCSTGKECVMDGSGRTYSCKNIVTVFVKSEGPEAPGRTGQNGTAFIQAHQQELSPKKPGFNIVAIHLGNGSIHSARNFDILYGVGEDVAMESYMTSLPDNVIVLVAVQESAVQENKSPSNATINALKNVVSFANSDMPGYRQPWVLIGSKNGDIGPTSLYISTGIAGTGSVSKSLVISHN